MNGPDTQSVIRESLRRQGLIEAGEEPSMQPLTGGVSSDIWRVETASAKLCVKRALPQLKVKQVWRAPVERNHYEAEWMRVVDSILPGGVPELLGEDQDADLLVMAYLEEDRHPNWKLELRDGRADADFAGRVGGMLAAIHSATAGRPDIIEAFSTDAIFYAMRLEPYLVATANRHPDLAMTLIGLAKRTGEARKALVHGDVSPKNILCGPEGPIFIDAECAWYGDPAFDLCFCLKHFLLKCLWTPSHTSDFLACFRAFASAYLEGVDWEPVADFEGRAATLLPGLFLARVDGKSPAEYLIEEDDKERVRRVARGLLQMPVDELEAVVAAWEVEVKG